MTLHIRLYGHTIAMALSQYFPQPILSSHIPESEMSSVNASGSQPHTTERTIHD